MNYVVALDVGGTSMKGGLVTRSGEVTPFAGHPTERERGPAAVVAAIRAYVGELAGHGRARYGGEPSGVGLAVPGIVTSSMAVYSANIGWRDVPAEEFVPGDVPARLGHDVRTGGLAESVFGAGRDTADFLFLPIGTGIAGAVVVRGEPYGGVHGWGGEIGHTTVWPSGEPCACGQIGCLETYASASAVSRRYERRSGRAATAKEVVTLAASGDPAAREVFDEAIEALAISLGSYTLLLDPSLIVIGGGLGEAGAVLFDPLRERLAARLAFCEPPELRPSALGVHAGMLGAALLGWQAAGEPGVGADWTPERLLGAH
ncbi:ROK family protein [Microtetraspora fusca]|uniref:ROK family protein n=1 Tax=Microtetraspora fusca TaxID=1997 RepID=A0ABW6VKY8_MICFU